MEPQAHYELSIEVDFVGPIPPGKINKAAPEATPATREAVEVVRKVLVEHGFTVCNVASGSRRTRVGTLL